MHRDGRQANPQSERSPIAMRCSSQAQGARRGFWSATCANAKTDAWCTAPLEAGTPRGSAPASSESGASLRR
eukprot:4865916-Alexandrium_andersonii.AAC.1